MTPSTRSSDNDTTPVTSGSRLVKRVPGEVRAAKSVTLVETETNEAVKKSEFLVKMADAAPSLITPGTISAQKQARQARGLDTPLRSVVKKKLFEDDDVIAVTPAKRKAPIELKDHDEVARTSEKKIKRLHNPESPAKRRLIFGRSVTEMKVKKSVRQIYKIVKQRTGSIGGNGCFGPIYGELTMGSMQKMINLMKEHTNFDSSSRFIDVGSGIGKPNLHVTQDPGVELSYGIEVEESRWMLGMTCLQGMLEAAEEQQLNEKENNASFAEDEKILHNCTFVLGDIQEAKSFNPFTHVYMFSIGFPPKLWVELANMWNRSSSPYLICYHGPRDIIETYEFNVELIAQMPTSMHGSKEGHMGYIYRRNPFQKVMTEKDVACDPYFKTAWGKVQSGLSELKKHVDNQVKENMGSGPISRSRKRLKTHSP